MINNNIIDATEDYVRLPVGPLGIIVLPGCEEMCKKVHQLLVKWRTCRAEEDFYPHFENEDPCVIKAIFPRYSSGEGFCSINQSVEGYDIYILCDIFNYSVEYKMGGRYMPMSPDEHFANLRRAISAVSGKAKRINVVMPTLYCGRVKEQFSRNQSQDCKDMLQDLYYNLGVDNIITLDCDNTIQNFFPYKKMGNIPTNYCMIKSFLKNVDDIKLNKDNIVFISPEEETSTSTFFSKLLDVDMGVIYKRRDYSTNDLGRSPVIDFCVSVSDIKNKDAIIVMDAITSGEIVIECAYKLKTLGAKRVFVFATAALLDGISEYFDNAYANNIIDKVFCANLTYYGGSEINSKEWFVEVNLTKRLAYIIDSLNYDTSILALNDWEGEANRIKKLLCKYGIEGFDENV